MSSEHQQAIRADALAMATDLDRYAVSPGSSTRNTWRRS